MNRPPWAARSSRKSLHRLEDGGHQNSADYNVVMAAQATEHNPSPLRRPAGCGELGTVPQSILTQDRDSGCNSHNPCEFDQNNH